MNLEIHCADLHQQLTVIPIFAVLSKGYVVFIPLERYPGIHWIRDLIVINPLLLIGGASQQSERYIIIPETPLITVEWLEM
jgi:hypothetical protein